MNDRQRAQVVRAILDRYHKTRLTGDPVAFILAGPQVQAAFDAPGTVWEVD